MRNALELADPEFLLFQKLLVEESGLFFEREKSEVLRSALAERMQKRGYDSLEEYHHFIKCHPEGRLEIRELLDRVTNGETHFFRNRAQFDALIRFVLPEILGQKRKLGERSIRVWSAGCSRGDEPYSVAMTLLEQVPAFEGWGLSILGTDLNRNGLEEARRGLYGAKDVAELPEGYLERYFEKKGTHYLLDEKVRRLVRFESHNLAKDPFALDGMREVDLLFCRNVVIYFDAVTTRRVMEQFYDCLAPHGYLFLGHAETLWQVTRRFQSVEFPRTFLYRKSARPSEEEAKKPFVSVPEIRPEEPAGVSEKPGSLTQATVLANAGKYQEAIEELGRVKEKHPLSFEASYLLGVLFYRVGAYEEAESQFRKVIYLKPDTPLGYLHLGDVYWCQKKYRKAEREFRNAIRILEAKKPEETVELSEDFTVDLLLRACKNKLEQVERGEREGR